MRITAKGRRTRWRTSQRTAGSRLTAMNKATSMSTRTSSTIHIAQKVSSTATTPNVATAALRKSVASVTGPMREESMGRAR
jgi:hypothetical protein